MNPFKNFESQTGTSSPENILEAELPEEIVLRDRREEFATVESEFRRAEKKGEFGDSRAKTESVNFTRHLESAKLIFPEDGKLLESANGKNPDELTDEERSAVNRKIEFIENMRSKGVSERAAETLFNYELGSRAYEAAKDAFYDAFRREKEKTGAPEDAITGELMFRSLNERDEILKTKISRLAEKPKNLFNQAIAWWNEKKSAVKTGLVTALLAGAALFAPQTVKKETGDLDALRAEAAISRTVETLRPEIKFSMKEPSAGKETPASLRKSDENFSAPKQIEKEPVTSSKKEGVVIEQDEKPADSKIRPLSNPDISISFNSPKNEKPVAEPRKPGREDINSEKKKLVEETLAGGEYPDFVEKHYVEYRRIPGAGNLYEFNYFLAGDVRSGLDKRFADGDEPDGFAMMDKNGKFQKLLPYSDVEKMIERDKPFLDSKLMETPPAARDFAFYKRALVELNSIDRLVKEKGGYSMIFGGARWNVELPPELEIKEKQSDLRGPIVDIYKNGKKIRENIPLGVNENGVLIENDNSAGYLDETYKILRRFKLKKISSAPKLSESPKIASSS